MTLETSADVSAEDLPTLPYWRESSTTLPREEKDIAKKKEQFSFPKRESKQGSHQEIQSCMF